MERESEKKALTARPSGFQKLNVWRKLNKTIGGKT